MGAGVNYPLSGYHSRKQRKRARSEPGKGWFRFLEHEDGGEATARLRGASYLSVRGRPSIKKLRRAVSIANEALVQ